MTSEKENEKHLQSFFHKEYQSLKTYVYSRIEDDVDRDAEDIIQDVALKIFSRKEVVPINNIAGFVYRAIRNRIVDVLRKQSTTTQIEDLDYQLSNFAEQFIEDSQNHYSEELVAALKMAIFKLKPIYRDIILAVDVEGYTYKELSEESGVSIGTLLSRRHRAISELHQLLKQQKEI